MTKYKCNFLYMYKYIHCNFFFSIIIVNLVDTILTSFFYRDIGNAIVTASLFVLIIKSLIQIHKRRNTQKINQCRPGYVIIQNCNVHGNIVNETIHHKIHIDDR